MSNIPTKETLTCEFKSDRKCLSDRDLIEAVVCMANGEGGDIYLGIEDNGKITGLHSKHTNLEGLSSLISNRTNPHVLVDITSISVETMTVAKITVPSLGEPVATNDGVIKRRRLQVNG
jgi:ATP-dependent DNA helicase RecG